MLDGADRTVLTEALRAPAGYALDRVVATTYSLDLVALLTLPLSFTFAQADALSDSGRLDPVRLLDALRRHADRLTVFCQAGRIAVPRRGETLFGFLEGAVVEARARHQNGVFHPKVAVARYVPDARDTTAEEEVPRATKYRFLCGTRNLTFDRSWDTLLVLQGDLVPARQHSIRRNRPLSDFFGALPKLSLRAMDTRREAELKQIAEELLRVEFEVPPGFSEDADALTFWPLGTGGNTAWPFAGRTDRMLIVSPFVDSGFLGEAKEQSEVVALVSRQEELDLLSPDALDGIASVFLLAEAAESGPQSDEDLDSLPSRNAVDGEADEFVLEPSAESLRGLHAKLFVADRGWNSSIWTGSANATKAAFSVNVEFLVELRGKRRDVGVDSLVNPHDAEGERGKRVRFSDMLVRYQRPPVGPINDEIAKQLENKLELVRRKLVDAQLTALCDPVDDDRVFILRVGASEQTYEPWPPGVSCKIRPVSLDRASSVDMILAPGTVAAFSAIAFESLTSFFAIEATAIDQDRRLTQEFVLKLPLIGAPEDREARLVLAMLSNRERLMRYLAMLLARDGMFGAGVADRSGHAWGSIASSGTVGLPLLEPILRTLAEDPSRLDDMDRLIGDLERTEEGRQLLPRELLALWSAVRETRSARQTDDEQSDRAAA